MFEVARRLLRYRLLAIWRRPTWVHLITLRDCVSAVVAAVEKPGIQGIYNVCDTQPLPIQAFLDKVAAALGYARPMRLPAACFWFLASICEGVARTFGTATPLNRDIMRMGMTSAVGDTTRFRAELLKDLEYPTADDGLKQLLCPFSSRLRDRV